ncbi:PREDICTED: putative glucose-6-phosphate 1-epimerase [Erythranthe guttata]|nr:PREDICTED: putative glucose-6-phosphate 1-epimerase [Erythranthe guttata]|eukprot:XP_012842738.1 PREDICTED: putative glucose-6-phosphate 1-epimerase [Erythranthe guttata]
MASSSSSSSSLDSEWSRIRIFTFRKIDDDDVLHGSVLLRHRKRRDTVEIMASTGQVVSWKNRKGEEMLFVSEKSVIKKDEPILGGIPVCFPRFINNGNIENTFPSGLILDRSVPQSDYKPILAFILGSSNRDSLNWPHKFEFRIKYHLLEENGTLEMESRIENTDDKPFTFQFCYQNYLAASNIDNIQIGGLDKLEYLDYQNNKNRLTEQNDKIAFRSEVDRVYVDVPAGGNNRVINVVDHAERRIYTIERSGTSLPDIVVWNPWIEKAKTIGDMGDEEYKNMVCVGPAAVVDPVTLNPGEAWIGKQSVSIHEMV